MRLPLALSLMLLTLLVGLIIGQRFDLPKLWESQHNKKISPPEDSPAAQPSSMPGEQSLKEHEAALRATLLESGLDSKAIEQHVEAVMQIHSMNPPTSGASPSLPSEHTPVEPSLEEHAAALRGTLQELGLDPKAIEQHVEAVMQQLQTLSTSPPVPR